MNSKDHECYPGPWPFPDERNVGVYSCCHILDEDRPILRVTHDEDDGEWQVLCGELHEASDGRLVCLGCMVSRDPSILILADLPLGWCADRDSAGDDWVRSKNE